MGWIKRNLGFVIVSILTLIALGGAGFYIFQSSSHNSDQSNKLNEYYSTLGQLNQEQPQPGNSNHDNLKLAKDQEQQLRAWINEAAGRFQPISPIPKGEVSSKTYATALNETIFQLQGEAKDNSVDLPPNKYKFSFEVQSAKLNISSGLVPLAQQLGEVKAIAEILYAARVNGLDGIQRVPVSDDDIGGGAGGAGGGGSQTDYTDDRPITNDLTIITPYVVTFRSFTPELAKVIAGFSTATNPFIVKSVSVQPASTSGMVDNSGGVPNQYRPDMMVPGRYGAGYPGGMPQGQPMPNGSGGGKGGLPTVLKEQLLRVTMEVEVVKLKS